MAPNNLNKKIFDGKEKVGWLGQRDLESNGTFLNVQLDILDVEQNDDHNVRTFTLSLTHKVQKVW